MVIVAIMLVLIIMILSGIPIAFSFAILGFAGIWYFAGMDQALSTLKSLPFYQLRSYELSCLITFILMAQAASISGISTSLFDCIQKWLGKIRGSLAISTCLASGIFAAVSSSSVATATAVGTVAYPEMKKHGYDIRLISGSVAGGGTVGIMIPPSIPLIVYGTITMTSVGALFMAGVLPGILTISLYIVAILLVTAIKPSIAPKGSNVSWKERFLSLKGVIFMVLLIMLVLGGIYGGIFTPTEAGAIGAAGSLVILYIRGKWTRQNILAILTETGIVSGAIYILIMGAMIFNRFLILSGIPTELSQLISGSQLSILAVLASIGAIYIILGCLMDPLGMLIITVPIFFPTVKALGIDPIWFAIFVVRMMEIGMVTPPVGLNLFAFKAIAPEEKFSNIMIGQLPFLAMDVIIVILLVKFPIIALLLPNIML